MTSSRDALERMAAELEASGEYRVLRRLTPGASLPCPPPGAKLGVVLDVETTGSDARQHEVIELAMLRFAYTPEARCWAWLRPSRATTNRPRPSRRRSPR